MITKHTLLNGDDECNHQKNGSDPEFTPREEAEMHSAKIFKQMRKDLNAEKNKKLQENVDSVAMYIFPCIFIIFNSIYWPYYLFYIEYWLNDDSSSFIQITLNTNYKRAEGNKIEPIGPTAT